MKVVVITGMSGAGITTALHALEDAGYFAVDNLPPALWAPLAQRVAAAGEERLAIAVDVRSHAFLDEAPDALRALEAAGTAPRVVYLDARNETLVRRFSFTRRTHPIGRGSLTNDLDAERAALEPLRSRADVVVDTTRLAAKELQSRMQRSLGDDAFRLQLSSFGYKRGVPTDVDAVLDVRGMRNPYYDPDLRTRPGTDRDVQAHVFSEGGVEAYARLREMIRELADVARTSGRGSYAVAIGCTGGQHRSVAVVERLAHDLADVGAVVPHHRDLGDALAEHGAGHDDGHDEAPGA